MNRIFNFLFKRPAQKPKNGPFFLRRFFRIRLRPFLVVCFVISIATGFYVYRIERQRTALKWGYELGGRFDFNSETTTLGKLSRVNGDQNTPKWLQDFVHSNYYSAPVCFYIENDDLRDISPLVGLTNLYAVSINSKQLTDLRPLGKLRHLRSLYIFNCPISDLTPLEGLKSLETLEIFNCPVSELASLEGLKNLETLILENTQVNDLSSLAKLDSLKSLTITCSPINDLSPLASCDNLEFLSLGHVPVRDLNPLSKLEKLHFVFLSSTALNEAECLRLQALFCEQPIETHREWELKVAD